METTFTNKVIVRDFGEANMEIVKRFLYVNARLWSMHQESENTLICDFKEPLDMSDIEDLSSKYKMNIVILESPQ